MLIYPRAIVNFDSFSFSEFFNAFRYIFVFKCFPMYAQTCEKVEAMIRLKNNWQSVLDLKTTDKVRVRNCDSLVANAIKNRALATKFSELVASWRLAKNMAMLRSS